jgi:hypothetical protein
MTSKWVRLVASQKSLDVDWRFISLRYINSALDYETSFPAGYDRQHTSGLELLRIAYAVREAHGNDGVAQLYEAYGNNIFETSKARREQLNVDTPSFVEPILEQLGFSPALKDAYNDTSADSTIQKESDYALSLTGKDVGTPILHFNPPNGTALFGPVISQLPSTEDAVALWNHVEGLSRFAGFAELKRSLREVPQLPIYQK